MPGHAPIALPAGILPSFALTWQTQCAHVALTTGRVHQETLIRSDASAVHLAHLLFPSALPPTIQCVEHVTTAASVQTELTF